MPRFLTGDELGHIKVITCGKNTELSTGWKLDEHILFTPSVHAQINSGVLQPEKAKEGAVQELSGLRGSEEKVALAAAKSNGTLSTYMYTLNSDNGELEILKEWKESRYKPGHKFVGLEASSKGLFWCTSNGALGLSALEPKTGDDTSPSSYRTASLPMRLCAWRLSPDSSSFAYGGNEVHLSVWDTERTFQNGSSVTEVPQGDGSNSAKKRKRGGDLFPAEIWRAKNLPNDSLNLRQPIYITSLSYLPASTGATVSGSVHLITGTETGDVRRYDTRATRRPIANWTGIAKVGGVGIVQAGSSEHELFVADNGTNLSALDLRNGRIIYSYKKLQGAITSLSPSFSGGFLGSASRDRYFRLHSTFPPPKEPGPQQEQRGEVLGALYMKSVPTTVVCLELDDELGGGNDSRGRKDEEGEDNDDVWAGMQNVNDSEGEDEGRAKVKRQP